MASKAKSIPYPNPASARPVKPVQSLSKPALIALVKLVIVGKVLCTGTPKPYEEVWEAGYAYRVGFGARGNRFCFVFNEDKRKEILVALGLGE